MVEVLLHEETRLTTGWYKAGEGVVFVESVWLQDGKEHLRLVYTKDDFHNPKSNFSHFVISKDGTITVSLDTGEG